MRDIIKAAIPGFVGTMLLEYAASKTVKRELYEPRDTVTSVAMGICNVILETAALGLHKRVYQWCYDHRLWDIPLQGAPRTLLLTLVEDFNYYCFHRGHHEVRMFWAAHVNHHSSEHYNLSTALRQSFTTPLTKIPFSAPLALFGFHPDEIERAHAINLLYQYWIHTELIDSLGPLEWVLNSPSAHRVHHGSNLKYLDTNYAGIFIIWDRLFGTYEAEDPEEPVVYGILHNIDTHRILDVAFHEWKAMLNDAAQARNPWHAVQHLLRKPGWSPDGSTLTVAQMRAEASAAANDNEAPHAAAE